MKKLVTVFSVIGFALGAFAQGTVTFNNSSTTAMRTNATGIGGTTGNATSALGSWDYALFTAASTVSTIDASAQALLTSTWTFTGLYATNSAATAGGRVSGGAGVA